MLKAAVRFLFFLGLSAVLMPGGPRADTYHTHTLVNITTASKDDVKFLQNSRIDVTGPVSNGFRALVTDEQLAMLADRGMRVEILYGEMAGDRMRWAEAEASYTLATSYYTASKFNVVNPPVGSLMERLLQLYNAHPTITRLYNLGASHDGAYDIIAMQVTRNPNVVEAEPKIRMYANIHGDEKGGVMVSVDVLETILAGYTAVPQNLTAKKLVDESEMWFIPIGNPYGNANSTRYNSRGVDLNRNFWGPSGSDVTPAWSEKETQVIRDLTETATADHSKKRFAASISFHEGAVVFNSIWNYTTAAPSDEPIFWSSRTGGTGCGSQSIPNCPTRAPHGLAQAYADGCTTPGFWYSEGFDWYGTRGDTNDWAYGAWTQLDTTIELNSQKTPPASQIPVYTAQHRQAVLNYMMKAFQGIHGVMTDQITGNPLDGTVAATATASASIPVPHAYQAVYTDPVAGDFHRILQPGTYTIVCNAPGYMPTTVTGVVVTADTESYANCPMNRTGLTYASSTVTDTCSTGGAYSGDGILDAGEGATLRLTLGNPGSAAATSVQGSISTTAPNVTITQATAAFANVPAGGTGASAAPHFAFTVAPGVACGTVLPFDVDMTSAEGSWDDEFTVTVGVPSGGTAQTLYAESFDGTTFPPTGWAQVDISGTAGNWARSTGTVHPTGGGTRSGAGLTYFNSWTAADGSSTRLYRTSGVSIPGTAVAAAVTLWMYHDTGYSGDPDRLQVQVSTNGTSWTNVGTAVSRYDGTTGWKTHSVSLGAYIGQSNVQIAFLGISSYGNDCHLDDVQVTYTLPGTCTMHACAAAPSADLAVSMSGPPSAATGTTIAYALGVSNGGPSPSSNVHLATSTPSKTSFVSLDVPAGWNCSSPSVGATGPVSCDAGNLASGASANFTFVVKVDWCAGQGAPIAGSATVSASTGDPGASNDFASASASAVDDGACDDGDGCTTADACSGSTCGGTPVGGPPEVGHGVTVGREGVDAIVTWVLAPGSTASSVVRGRLDALPVGSTPALEQCVASGVPGSTATDAGIPPPATGFWYLVRGESACGAGPYGYQRQNGAPTVPEITAACP